MIFKDLAHEKFYLTCIAKSDCSHHDTERLALFYTLGIMDTTRSHIDSIYDFTSNQIITTALDRPFQTSGSKALTQLGFVLYNNFKQPHPDHEDVYLSPSLLNIFCSLDQDLLPYLFQAIALRCNAENSVQLLPLSK